MKSVCQIIFLLPLTLYFNSAFAQTIGDAYPSSIELIEKGVAKHDSAEFDEAVKLFEQVQEGDSLYPRAVYEMALSCNADSNYTRALELINEYLKFKIDDRMNALAIKGSILDGKGDYDEAIRMFSQVITDYNHSYRGFSERAIAEVKAKDYQSAMNDLANSLIRNPYVLSTHVQIALLACDADQPALAHMAMYFAIMESADNPEYCLSLLKYLESITSHETDRTYEDIPSQVFEFADDLQEINEIIYSRTALSKKYKSKTSVSFIYAKQMQMICERLKSVPDSDNPILKFYCDFYRKVWNEGYFEGMITMIWPQFTNAEAQKISSKYKKQINAFIDQSSEVITSTLPDLEFTYRGVERRGKTYFEHGYLLAVGNKKSSSGLSDGEWLYFYPTGGCKVQGTFKDGAKEGKWQVYDEDGTLLKVENYENNIANGEYLEYNRRGILIQKANKKAGVIAGQIVEYKPEGNLDYTYSLNENRELTDIFTYYEGLDAKEYSVNYSVPGKGSKIQYFHLNGALKYEVDLLDNQMNGPVKVYNDEGKILSEGAYEKGKVSGLWKYYFPNGRLQHIGNYLKGEYIGEWKEYEDNGTISGVNNYTNGKLNGLAVSYDNYGRKLAEIQYRNGRNIEYTCFDADGAVLHQSKTNDGVFDIDVYNSLRIKVAEGILKKEKYEGEWKYYQPNGVLKSVFNYKNDIHEGPAFEYHSNGKLKNEVYYRDGNIDGFAREYYASGIVKEESYYKDGNLHGSYKSYYPDGKIEKIAFYWNGKLNGKKLEYSTDGILQNTLGYSMGLDEFILSHGLNNEVVKECVFKNGTGDYLSYYPDGSLFYKVSIKNGLCYGEANGYNRDGSILSQTQWSNGLVHGSHKRYKLGELSVEGQFKEGKSYGNWKYYNEGQVEFEINYLDGDRQGRYLIYYPGGKIYQERFYKDDLRDSSLCYYDPSGALMIKMFYFRGVLLSYTYPGPDGKLLPEIPLINETGKVVAYYQNGKKSVEFEMVHGDYTGVFAEYYSDGKPKQTTSYVNGLSDGISRVYYPGGQLKKEIENKMGDECGLLKTYYENGKLKSEETMVWDNLDGPAKYYDKNGKLKLEGSYYGDGFIKK